MTVKIQLRRDTAINWAAENPILSAGEMGIETDTHLFKFGDDITAWNDLPYAAVTPEAFAELVAEVARLREKVDGNG